MEDNDTHFYNKGYFLRNGYISLAYRLQTTDNSPTKVSYSILQSYHHVKKNSIFTVELLEFKCFYISEIH